MSLEKATITNVDTNDTFQVLFNPSEYQLKKETPWAEQRVLGLDAPAASFTTGMRMELSMELFFDTSEEKSDVRTHTEKIEKLLMVDPDKHRPPLTLFTWGNFQFKGVFEKLKQRYTMFVQDGTPVRAVLDVTIKEYTTTFEQLQRQPRQSADRAKHRIVRRGDTLSLIAHREYNDASEWRRIAEYNQIEDPLDLEPGLELTIPPIE
ncbi:MAG: LysM peptidoglycan-binding domain-containing protein [candidate division Zixibacteria bacterium]|nr:LysM peptidoglycan-binding domain-containing protein [candidate division Zixibacteria bacterium]